MGMSSWMTTLGTLGYFLRSKNEAFQNFVKFSKAVQKGKDAEIGKVRSDHGKEFENSEFKSFCEDHGKTGSLTTQRGGE